MAITVTDTAFGTIVIPGAYTKTNVRSPAAGLGAFGIVAIVGESTQGPGTGDTTTSENIENNFYTPNQIGTIISKYGSGNLVEAFKALASPSNDALISGSVTRIYVYKTNNSTSATSSVSDVDGPYATLSAQVQGVLGNQLKWDVQTATTAVAPSTGAFSYAPVPTNGTSALLKYRMQGGSQVTGSIGANQTPTTVASNLSSLDFLVTGGVDRGAVVGLTGVTATLTASGTVITMQLSGSSVFATTPVVGDVMLIPTGGLYNSNATINSTFAGSGSSATVNGGAYFLTAVSNVAGSAILTAKKMDDNVNITVSNPINVVATFSATVSNDLQIYSPLTFTNMAGGNRNSLVNLTNSGVTLTASGSSLRINVLSGQIFGTGPAAPRSGDTMYIPSGSVVAGAGSANVGWYSVSSINNVTNNCYLIATRLSNGNPVNNTTVTITSNPNNDIKIVRPWLHGQKPVLEIVDNGGTTPLNTTLFNLATTTGASFISSATNTVLVTGTEYQATFDINRSVDGVQESYVAIGGNAALQLGYLGTTATVSVSATNMVFTVTGGAGANLTVTFSNFSSLKTLADFINSQTGYAAAVPNSAVGALPPTVLDQGSFTLCTSTAASALPCIIKKDAYDFAQALAKSPTVSATMIGVNGLPESTQGLAFFLSGGAVNGTTGAQFNAAIDALARVDLNFIVPLFSQNATADIAAGLTDPSSTYTIAAINAYVNSHCVAMSAPKRRKNRLAVCSIKDTYANAKAQALSLASSSVALTFQDVKGVGVNGSIVQFQPWYGACIAAGMQAIGLYRSISRKFANVSGFVNPTGFTPKDSGLLEDALLSGLLVLENPSIGGYRWVSDQTTYGKDANFVFNSLQVMYTANFMAVDLANSFDNFAVGQAISDISAGAALVFLQTKMGQYFNNKLIAPSGSANAGYDSASVTLNGPVMQVGVNAYITNAISFVLITFNVSQVSQSAS